MPGKKSINGSRLSHQLNYASNRANKKARTSEYLDPNNVSPSGNRSFSEWKSEYDAEYTRATNDFIASTRYDDLLGRSSMPKSGAAFRDVVNGNVVPKYNMFTLKKK